MMEKEKKYLMEGRVIDEVGGSKGLHLITYNILVKFQETFDNPYVQKMDFGSFHVKFLRNMTFTLSEYEEGIDFDKMKK